MGNRIYIGTRASVIDDDGVLWLSEYFFNGLFRFDINSGECSFIGGFPGEAPDKKEMHIGAFSHKTKVVFTPYVSSSLHIYDKIDGSFSIIKLPREFGLWYGPPIHVGDGIFFLSEDGHVIKLNLLKMEISIDDDLSKKYMLFKKKYPGNAALFIGESAFTAQIDRHIIDIDILENKTKEYLIPCENDDIEYIVGKSKTALFFSMKKVTDIMKCNNNGDYQIIHSPSGWGKDAACAYNKIVKLSDEDIVVNYNSFNLLKLNKDDETASVLNDDFSAEDITHKGEWAPLYHCAHIWNGYVCFVPCSSKWLYKYDIHTKTMTRMELVIDDAEIKTRTKIMGSRIKRSFAVIEDDSMNSLKCLIDYISEGG